MLRVSISLPSGCGETLLLPEVSTVGDLKVLAQKSLGHGLLKLVTVKGHVLTNPTESLQAAGVQDGEQLMAVVQQGKVAATKRHFAAWCYGGDRIVTWGRLGDNSSTNQGQLRNVRQIHATKSAFAAILANGSIVAWGNPGYGW